MFRILRIVVLLLVLATVAQQAWLARSRAADWRLPLQVALYPINGDGSAASAAYIADLRPDSLERIERYFDEEAKRHGQNLHQSVRVRIAPALNDVPPQPPHNGSIPANIAWSLHMRWWAWRHDSIPDMKPDVRMFVLYFDPRTHERLPNSVGLSQGMLGRVNAFAAPNMAGSNAVIITHELLHTLGATDKYDAATNQPRYPEGYAEPDRQPRYPQVFAEIMGGRIPRSASESDIPPALAATLIGDVTASEIGWTRK